MRFQRNGSIVTADLHGVYERDARDILYGWLDRAPADVTALRVNHGNTRGTTLRDMIRGEFAHPRVKSELPSLNRGETRRILGKK